MLRPSVEHELNKDRINTVRVIQKAKQDWTRFCGWVEPVLRAGHPVIDRSLRNSGVVVDVGCGWAECAPGIVEALLNLEIENTSYYGFDIAVQEATIPEILVYARDNGFLTQNERTVIDAIEDRMHIYFDPKSDARQIDSFRHFVNEKAENPGIYLIRHPEVRTQADTFQRIIDTTFTLSYEKKVPLVITTSNPISQEIIYKIIGKIALLNGFKLVDELELVTDSKTWSQFWPLIDFLSGDRYFGTNFVYENGLGKRLRINTLDTSAYERVEENVSVTQRGIFNRRLDSITIIATTKKR